MVITEANASKSLDHKSGGSEDCKCGPNPDSGPARVNVVPHLTFRVRQTFCRSDVCL